MKSSNIKSFAVYGLFGTNDVHIPFDEDIKILVGENGLGKTQVLNLFYYTLTRNFFRLSEFSFDKLVLAFSNSQIEITKEQINNLEKQFSKLPFSYKYIEDFGYAQFKRLLNDFLLRKGDGKILDLSSKYSNKNYNQDYLRYFNLFQELEQAQKNKILLNKHFNNCDKKIEKILSFTDIMYFPTYRRVEADLHNLGYEEEKKTFSKIDNIIQFGMNDVEELFEEIQNNIDKLLKEGLSDFTKDILKILVSPNLSIDENIFQRIDEENLEIIFARLGKEIDEDLKNAVRNTVKEKKMLNPYSALLLQKLVVLYEKQKEINNNVKDFKNICNHYLINKKVFYDESAIKIFIKSEITGDEIALSKLSSGEKQIISIFSKIYLSDVNKRFLVLFDEPELSLSMLWQKQLLPDIIHSKKCDFLLAVTHSPFIFDNELDMYAVGLNEYVKPAKIITI